MEPKSNEAEKQAQPEESGEMDAEAGPAIELACLESVRLYLQGIVSYLPTPIGCSETNRLSIGQIKY